MPHMKWKAAIDERPLPGKKANAAPPLLNTTAAGYLEARDETGGSGLAGANGRKHMRLGAQPTKGQVIEVIAFDDSLECLLVVDLY